MIFLLFAGPSPSLANRFGLRRSQLLFHFGCCTLGTFATETTGKLAPVICVDVGVVLSPRNGYVREAVVDQQLIFLGVHVDQHSIRGLPLALAGHCVAIVKVRVLEKLIPNRSVLALTARTGAFQPCLSLIPKTKQVLRVGHNEPQGSKQRVYFQ